MQNFKTFHTNFPLKTGLINVGRLWLQFRSVIGGKEVRIDSPFWDFGITVTCLWRVGVDWLGNPCAVRRSSEQRWSACSRSQYSSACATREEMGMRNTDYFLTITIGPTIARTNGLWLCLNWILHWENIFDNKAGVAFFLCNDPTFAIIINSLHSKEANNWTSIIIECWPAFILSFSLYTLCTLSWCIETMYDLYIYCK